MPLPRILEPEVMDGPDDAADYDAMDHSTVNARFVADLLSAGLLGVSTPDSTDPETARQLTILDVGTGTARIPLLLLDELERLQLDPPVDVRIMAADAAVEMLRLARLNVEIAARQREIQLDRIDAKTMPYADGMFDAVISNTIIHHIPEPQSVLAEMQRVCRPGGMLFVRDLARPDNQKQVTDLVTLYAGNEAPHAQKLFRDSLYAALTVEEVKRLLKECGVQSPTVTMTSDRHWTWSDYRA